MSIFKNSKAKKPQVYLRKKSYRLLNYAFGGLFITLMVIGYDFITSRDEETHFDQISQSYAELSESTNYYILKIGELWKTYFKSQSE